MEIEITKEFESHNITFTINYIPNFVELNAFAQEEGSKDIITYIREKLVNSDEEAYNDFVDSLKFIERIFSIERREEAQCSSICSEIEFYDKNAYAELTKFILELHDEEFENKIQERIIDIIADADTEIDY